MRRLLRSAFVLPILLSAAACGGGDGDPAAGTSDLSGTLTLTSAAPQAIAQRALDPLPTRRGDSMVRARRLAGEAIGMLERERGGLAVLRWVALRAGRIRARIDPGAGPRPRHALHHLDRGDVATALDVREGDVVDLVLWIGERDLAAYRAAIEFDDSAEALDVELPACYVGCAARCAPGEIIVSPARGESPHRLAWDRGLDCVSEGPACAVLRDRFAAFDAEGEFRGLSRLLAHCARLEASGRVHYAEPNYLRRLTAVANDTYFAGQWALDQIRVPAAWELDKGQAGVVVAIIDSGVKHAHPDLEGRLLPGYDFEDDDHDPEDPKNSSSHGTHVAGIIAAATDNSEGIAGVVWGGRILPMRAFNENGFGSASDVANAIRYAAGLSNRSGELPDDPARIINLSFASTTPTQTEQDACDAARGAGALLIAASGNEGAAEENYPAAYDSVLAVGATDRSGRRASYSNYGNWLDLVAPGGTAFDGIRVLTVANGNPTYGFANGTSFAAPHVAGVAALCLSVRNFTAGELEQLLTSTAQDIGGVGFDLFTGYGVVHAYAALSAALEAPASILIPGEEVEIRLVGAGSGIVRYGATTTEGESLAWTLQGVEEGQYHLEAGTDRDFDGDISDPGEVYGRWRDEGGGDILVVEADTERTALDFPIEPR